MTDLLVEHAFSVEAGKVQIPSHMFSLGELQKKPVSFSNDDVLLASPTVWSLAPSREDTVGSGPRTQLTEP